jgi:hypothetical protein
MPNDFLTIVVPNSQRCRIERLDMTLLVCLLDYELFAQESC